MLNISYWWLLMELHKPFSELLRSNAPPEHANLPLIGLSVELCDRAASKITQLINLFNACYNLRSYPRNMIPV